jgi:DNA polymerase elongation subunit (family B)
MARKKLGLYAKPCESVVAWFKERADRNRRNVADEVGLFLDLKVMPMIEQEKVEAARKETFEGEESASAVEDDGA